MMGEMFRNIYHKKAAPSPKATLSQFRLFHRLKKLCFINRKMRRLGAKDIQTQSGFDARKVFMTHYLQIGENRLLLTVSLI